MQGMAKAGDLDDWADVVTHGQILFLQVEAVPEAEQASKRTIMIGDGNVPTLLYAKRWYHAIVR